MDTSNGTIMKKLILIPITFALLSGCISSPSFTIISTIHNPHDELRLDFHLPSEFNPNMGTQISYNVEAPNGTAWGTYHIKNNLTIHNPHIILDCAGIWHVEYKIYEGLVHKITGDHAFFIPTGRHYRHEFILTEYEIVDDSLSFTVENVGREGGYVSILIYDDRPLERGNITFYGNVYFETKEYLGIGHEILDDVFLYHGAEPVMLINEVIKR